MKRFTVLLGVAWGVGKLVGCGGDDPAASTPDADGGVTPAGDSSIVTSDSSVPVAPSGRLFPPDFVFNKDVSALPPAAVSNAMITALGKWGNGDKFQIGFDFYVLQAAANSPMVTPDTGGDDESDAVPVPIVAGGAIEESDGYTCPRDNQDCHYLAISSDQKMLFELYGSTETAPGKWLATQESAWDLTKSYGPNNRGFGCTSADAAGLPITPGLIRVKEVVTDHAIEHALRFILPNPSMRKGSLVAPASHYGAPSNTDPNAPPYGVRFRLKSSFNEATIASAGGKVVVRALKKYGMILADGGQVALVAERDRFTTEKWGKELAPTDLASIKVADFEVVDLANVQTFTARPSCTLGK